jgi:hypothetical protein
MYNVQATYLFVFKKCSNIWLNTLLGAVYFSRSDPPTLLYKLEKREKTQSTYRYEACQEILISRRLTASENECAVITYYNVRHISDGKSSVKLARIAIPGSKNI